jgi:hypothetical protein
MLNARTLTAGAGVALLSVSVCVFSQEKPDRKPAPSERPHDAVAEAQTPREVPRARPEQKKNAHDRSDAFDPNNARPVTPALDNQPEGGRIAGFDFARDPLDAKRPMQPPIEIVKEDMAMKPKVNEAQRKLLGRATT